MSKPTCVFSAPVRVFAEELMAVLKGLHEEPQHSHILKTAAEKAYQRLLAQESRTRRSDAYKMLRLVETMADQLSGKGAEDLRSLINAGFVQKTREETPKLPKDHGCNMPIFRGNVEALLSKPVRRVIPMDPVEAKLMQRFFDSPMEPTGISLHEEMPLSALIPPQPEVKHVVVEEDFATELYVPKFEDFTDVFKDYPYAVIKTINNERVIAVGYTSGRDRQGRRFRRNCVVVYPSGKEFMFNDLSSTIGVLTHSAPNGIHYTVKTIPLINGVGMRFWTNIIGVGDIESFYRYRIFTCTGSVGQVNTHGFQDYPHDFAWRNALDALATAPKPSV